ncbi:hypothetical protein DRW48_05665 [Paracoccus suum]|uniref:Uncharacterized protein n=1 Tax=Paracoccus suum TaxID=2259340 RepID=A0A344PIN3_9RHOB|nr:hypothetical protein DRW48_05665 [Paracoccus suum]
MTHRPEGKVLAIRWTEGPDDQPVGDAVNHAADLNLIVTTAGYHAGDCIKVEVRSDDGLDVAEGVARITLTGRVGADGRLRLSEPLRPYTLILSNPETDRPLDLSKGASRQEPLSKN